MQRIITLILLFPSLPSISNAQEYPIHIMEEGHIIIQVQLTDSITGNFVLDTGAGVTVLSGKLFNKVSSQAKKKGYFTGYRHDGDRLDGEVYEIPALAVGAIQQFRPVVGIYPPLDAMGIDGLLSLKFFEDKPFSIDFKNRSIAFIDNEQSLVLAKNNTALPLELYQHTNVMLDIFIPITINDSTEVLAEFDTGSGYDAYIVHTGYLNDLNLNPTEGRPQTYETQLSREKREDVIHTVNSIAIGEGEGMVRLTDVAVIFREGLIYNALVGSGMFKNKIITIDIPNRTFIVHR